jgi:hypothetical protein
MNDLGRIYQILNVNDKGFDRKVGGR